MKFTPYDISKNSSKYSIPIYQRLFEWDSDNIAVLMEDLKKSFDLSHGKGDYYIGMLTSTKDNELVDGQQRFTVMMLIGCVLQQYAPVWKDFLLVNDEQPRLHFASRPLDDTYMQMLIDGGSKVEGRDTFVNAKMQNGINVIKAFVNNPNNIAIENKQPFAEYIFRHLSFFISELPSNYSPRDLNKYFERMNTTGKNLEQHEILKVKLLSNLTDNVSTYMTLWNKLSDVDTLLIRKRKDENEHCLAERKSNAFKCSINELISRDILNGMGKTEEGSPVSISNVPQSSTPPYSEKEQAKDSHCALTFPYLLLQALYRKIDGKINGKISDFFKASNLLDTFGTYLPYEGDCVNKEEIKDFMEILVKSRLALDICFIRPSEYGYSLDMNQKDEEEQSLKPLLMLESMLYVSSSNYTHYRWFNWLLSSIERNQGIPSAQDLYKDLNNEDKKLNSLPPYESLSFGKEIRYWFWRLDLYIWENRKVIFRDYSQALAVAENYIFRRNRSIEHIAPQTPLSDSVMKWNDTEDDSILRNSFGNLAMISQGLNSSLSNESYEVKKAHVQSYMNGAKTGSIESLKLLIVHTFYKIWNKETIEEHGRDMYQWLEKQIN